MKAFPKKKQIIHVDMDAFYASVEQRDNPDLLGKPVVVGGNPDSRGVASTCSYEARKYGIRSAMPLSEARRRCPHAIFIPVDMPKYVGVSAQIHRIFEDYTPIVEPISLDEAFLDVTDSLRLFGSAQRIATEIKDRIRKELMLTASVGVAPNKFLAKLASDVKKPDGFVVISKEEEIQDFLDPLPIERIWGVGPKTAQKLHQINIKTIKELRSMDEIFLQTTLGSIGSQLFYLSRGIDHRPLEIAREAKSIGRETTFPEDLIDPEVLQTVILDLSSDVARKLRKESMKAKTITLKIRFADFRTLSKSRTLNIYTNHDKVIFTEASLLFKELRLTQPLRLVGVSVHHLAPEEIQQSLFDTIDLEKDNLIKTIDTINQRFGKNSITLARLLKRRCCDNPD